MCPAENPCPRPVLLNLFTCWHPICITNQFSHPHLELKKIDEDQKKIHQVRRCPIFHAKPSIKQKNLQTSYKRLGLINLNVHFKPAPRTPKQRFSHRLGVRAPLVKNHCPRLYIVQRGTLAVSHCYIHLSSNKEEA